MKMVLFDLGNTLEKNDVLFPGATKTLSAIQLMKDQDGNPLELALISDFLIPATPDEIPIIQQQYYQILDNLGILPFFEPVTKYVTLSTEIGISKPDERIFRTAIEKIDASLQFGDVLFITENGGHVEAARALGMGAIQFKPPGQTDGEVDNLVDLLPIVEQFFDIPSVP